MKVCCVFSLESRHRGDSNEYTQYTIFNVKENNRKLFQICSYGLLSQGTQERIRKSRGNEPSVFEPLKFYCILLYNKDCEQPACVQSSVNVLQ